MTPSLVDQSVAVVALVLVVATLLVLFQPVIALSRSLEVLLIQMVASGVLEVLKVRLTHTVAVVVLVLVDCVQ